MGSRPDYEVLIGSCRRIDKTLIRSSHDPVVVYRIRERLERAGNRVGQGKEERNVP